MQRLVLSALLIGVTLARTPTGPLRPRVSTSACDYYTCPLTYPPSGGEYNDLQVSPGTLSPVDCTYPGTGFTEAFCEYDTSTGQPTAASDASCGPAVCVPTQTCAVAYVCPATVTYDGTTNMLLETTPYTGFFPNAINCRYGAGEPFCSYTTGNGQLVSTAQSPDGCPVRATCTAPTKRRAVRRDPEPVRPEGERSELWKDEVWEDGDQPW